jgi:hypothetical protein
MEIERKFLVSRPPDLVGTDRVELEPAERNRVLAVSELVLVVGDVSGDRLAH